MFLQRVPQCQSPLAGLEGFVVAALAEQALHLKCLPLGLLSRFGWKGRVPCAWSGGCSAGVTARKCKSAPTVGAPGVTQAGQVTGSQDGTQDDFDCIRM